MKLKIIEQGWENFSGNLGVTAFQDGVSVNDVPRVEINSISGNLRVVDAETGHGVGVLEIDPSIIQNTPCVTSNLQTMEEILAGQAPNQEAPVEQVAPVNQSLYSVEQLEVIADKKGIAGLREIADPLTVKGTSILKLIEGIIAAQGGNPVSEEVVEPAFVEDAGEIEE